MNGSLRDEVDRADPAELDKQPRFLFGKGEALSLKEAAARANRTTKTVKARGKEFGISRRSLGNGRIEINVVGLEMVCAGDSEALALLLAGHRSDPIVRRYLELCGLAG